ncbi:MarR family winged helix-turn-helix transcriptional regulator [Oceanobacillus jeddahense]|uniref:MarR family transcriptional regulator n=1 Tax=Oceanobacillus jeddahense TaxID=1462527 RepID=A0ABY5JU27_9BACI|nr:MarR family transcriptional regulator [Oceanobacillus jeddahense]UUI03780.1 MarR family transcriptional regulator [Oceanobacillus jeddahense]
MEGLFRNYIRIHRQLMKHLNDLLEKYQLSYSLWQVIIYLEESGKSTLVDISNYYQVEKPSITRRVHRLLEAGLIKEVPSANRREKIIELTSEGKRVYQVCRKEITALEHHVSKGLTEEEQQTAFQFLMKIQDNIQRKEGFHRE